MRLLHCQLRNVRVHGDLAFEFSPRITLIGGANESGKSTLVEALHRALFLKASATGAPVEAMQSRLHLGPPIVQLTFEAKGETWTLRKRFSGSSGQVSLHAQVSGRQLSGPAAEEVLADLLGVKESVGSRQATSVLPTRWAHLWVLQGYATDNPLEAGKASYDFDALLAHLERSGGAALQQSAHDQRVAQRLEAALEENFTSRGVRKHSPLWQRQEELGAARATLESALARLEEYEEAGETLARIGEQLEQLQNTGLPALLEQRRLISESAEAIEKLEGTLRLAAQGLEPIRLRHEATCKALREIDTLVTELSERQQQLHQLREAQGGVAERERALIAALETRRAARGQLQLQRQTLEHRQRLIQLLVEKARVAEAIQRLSKDLEQLRRASDRRGQLEQELRALPPIHRREIQQLRDLYQTLRDARTRQQAMAAGVRLLEADQPVRINGETLASGEQRLLGSVFEVRVGDGVVLEISPGGGRTLADLQQRCTTAERAVVQMQNRLGVASLQAAEQCAERRILLEQQLAALGDAPPQDARALEAQLEGLRQRATELDDQLPELTDCRQALEREQPLPGAAADLQNLQQQLARNLHHNGTALRQAEAELEIAQADLHRLQADQVHAASQLQVIQAELADRHSRLETLVQSHGPRDGLAAQLAALAQERQRAEAELARLQAERTTLGGRDPERDMAMLQQRMEALQLQIEQLIDQRGAAKQRCDSISEEDPYAAVEQARTRLEAAESDYRSLQRLTQAQRLLQQLFAEAQADLSSRYSEPLARAIGSYLRPLVPEGPVVQVDFDQASGFSGLRLRRGQEFYGFEELSGGMREQLAAALRLSMADVLKSGHDGCLPLVFDDAFTNSDPERVDLVQQMLATAVERGLQVIVLTCDPARYGPFADQVVALEG